MNSSEIYYKALDLERLYDLAFKYDFEIAVKDCELLLIIIILGIFLPLIVWGGG